MRACEGGGALADDPLMIGEKIGDECIRVCQLSCERGGVGAHARACG